MLLFLSCKLFLAIHLENQKCMTDSILYCPHVHLRNIIFSLIYFLIKKCIEEKNTLSNRRCII